MSTKLAAPTVLKKIFDRKMEEVAERRQRRSISELELEAQSADPVRGFRQALADRGASPSKGIIRPDFHPGDIARSYEEGGAACLSVLTDIDFFQGADHYLEAARAACSLPVLRKDFTLDPYQIIEARALGADAILLIVACLEMPHLEDLHDCATEMGLDVLVEVHDEAELEEALAVSADLIGINNRNLHTFETSLETTFRLLDSIPSGIQVVTESGFSSAEQISKMRRRGVQTFLIGEAFMRVADPGSALAEMFSPH